MSFDFIFAFLWISLALLVCLLFSKLMKVINFPNVTGFLIAGIVIGPWVIGLCNQDLFTKTVNSLDWISQLALGFIAFTIGGSFKKSALKSVGKNAVIISIFEAIGGAIVVCLFLFIAYFAGLKNSGLTPSLILILSSIACATAPAATLLVISQFKAKGPVTDTLIPVVAFDDAVALIAFSILFSISKILTIGGAFNPIDALLIPFLEIIFSLLIGAVVGFLISLGTKWFKSRHNRLILCIIAVLFCIGISLIDTKTIFHWSFSFQLSSLLTIMACGAIYVNFAKGIETTNEYLDKFSSPIFMLFFAISGSKLNFGVFGNDKFYIVIIIAFIYLLSRIIGKWAGSAFSSKITNCPKVVQKYLGFTLIPQAGVALGLAGNAQAFYNSIGDTSSANLIYTIIIISTMVYELIGPLATKWALKKAGEIKI